MNSDITVNQETEDAPPTMADYMKFIIPSMMGVILFLIPIKTPDGGTTILFSVVTDIMKSNLAAVLPYLLVIITAISGVATVYYSLKSKSGETFSKSITKLFVTNWLWIVLRVLGAIFTVLVVFKIGPDIITSEGTGGTMISFLGDSVPGNGVTLFFGLGSAAVTGRRFSPGP